VPSGGENALAPNPAELDEAAHIINPTMTLANNNHFTERFSMLGSYWCPDEFNNSHFTSINSTCEVFLALM